MPSTDVKAIPFVPVPAAISDWTTVGTDVDLEDWLVPDSTDTNGFITDPATQIGTIRQVFTRSNLQALFVGLRMRYKIDTEPTDPTVKLFGRVRYPDGTVGDWQVLRNRLKDSSVVILTDPADTLASGLLCTIPDQEAHYFDLQGCNEFVIGVEVAVTGCLKAFPDVKFI